MRQHALGVLSALLVASVANDDTVVAASASVGLIGYYLDDNCTAFDSYGLQIWTTPSCANSTCSGRKTVTCTNDYQAQVNRVYGVKPFVQALQYADDQCGKLTGGAFVPIDGQCHAMNGLSFRAVLNGDNTVTSSIYSDTKCSKEVQVTVVSSDNVGQCVGSWVLNVTNQLLGRGPFTVMSYYTDYGCLTQPLIVALPAASVMQGGVCKSSTCVSRVTTQCTQNPMEAVATSAANISQYVMEQTFADTQNCGNQTLVKSVVLPIDAKCHAMRDQSFMAVQSADKSVTMARYKDSSCTTTSGGPLLTSRNVGMCRADGTVYSVVTPTLGAGPLIQVPPPPSPIANTQPSAGMISYYTDDNCNSVDSYGLQIWTTPSCANSTCSGRKTVTCTNDYQAQINSVYGVKPFVQALQYADDQCGKLTGGAFVPIDGQCHTMNSTSFRAVLNGDNTVTSSIYSDTKCSKEVQVTVVSSDNAGQCVGGWQQTVVNQKLGKSPFSIMSYYADDKCVTPPSIVAVPAISLTASGVCKNSTCVGRVSTLCSQNPVNAVATMTANLKQYVMVQSFVGTKTCGQESLVKVTVVPIDGVCHPVLEQFSIATLSANKTVLVNRYADSACKTLPGGSSTGLSSGNATVITSSSVGVCQADGNIFSVVGVTLANASVATTPRPTFGITAFFDNTKCSSAPGMVTVSPSSSANCSNIACTNQVASSCVDDYGALLYLKNVSATFGSKPYVAVASFAKDNCASLQSATVVKLDGVCRGTGGMFLKAAQDVDLSFVVSYFSDSKCSKLALPAIKVSKHTADKCPVKGVLAVVNLNLIVAAKITI